MGKLYLYFSDRGTRLRTTCRESDSRVLDPKPTRYQFRHYPSLFLFDRGIKMLLTFKFTEGLPMQLCFFLKPFWKCYKVFMNKKFIYTTANDLEQDNMTLKYWLTNTYPHGKDVRRTIHCDILNH